MRLGGGTTEPYSSPEEWLTQIRALDYSAVIFPVDSGAERSVQEEYLACIRENDLVIGEVGVWRNVLSQDKAESAAALDYAVKQLELADRVGARCCVNISGSYADYWDAYHPRNYAPETYDLIVKTTQFIIDEVRPENTYFSLEPMPWMLPDSPESYLRLMRDVDRERFAVHLDFANMINGVERYHDSRAFIRGCFEKLGKYIRSIHVKDALLGLELPACIREAIPGEGGLDIADVLRQADALGGDMTLFVEHLDTNEQYARAARSVRAIAEAAGVYIK